METAIRGYHVYSAVWNAKVGEVLYCERELNNLVDGFAVDVKLQHRSSTSRDNFLDSHGIFLDVGSHNLPCYWREYKVSACPRWT